MTKLSLTVDQVKRIEDSKLITALNKWQGVQFGTLMLIYGELKYRDVKLNSITLGSLDVLARRMNRKSIEDVFQGYLNRNDVQSYKELVEHLGIGNMDSVSTQPVSVGPGTHPNHGIKIMRNGGSFAKKSNENSQISRNGSYASKEVIIPDHYKEIENDPSRQTRFDYAMIIAWVVIVAAFIAVSYVILDYTSSRTEHNRGGLYEQKTTIREITADSVNFRVQPSLKEFVGDRDQENFYQNIIAKFQKGDKVEIFASQDAGGRIGGYLLPFSIWAIDTSNERIRIDKGLTIHVSSVDSLYANCKTELVDSKPVVFFMPITELESLQDYKWIRVRYKDDYGFVLSKYLK